MSTSRPFGGIVTNMAVPESTFRPWAVVALAAGIFLPASAVLAQEVYRWVDDEGEVHYNTTLPAEYANRPHQILKNGIVIDSIDDPTAPQLTPEQEEKAEAKKNPEVAERKKRVKADRLLVLKYHSEDEILDAMQVEIDNLSYDSRLIDQTRDSVMESLSGEIREAADRQRSGQPVDQETNKKIAQLRARIRQGEASKSSLDSREKQIRQHFDSDLKRYRFLMNGGSPGEVDPSESGSGDET
jgi:hypothetical protein